MFESRELSVEMTPAKDFLKFNPPLPPGFPESLTPPPSGENFQNPIRRGGVDFFWNNPIRYLLATAMQKHEHTILFGTERDSFPFRNGEKWKQRNKDLGGRSG